MKFKKVFAAAAAGLILSTTAGASEMKKSSVDTVFPQGEVNPYSKFFTGQTYLTRLSAKDSVWNAPIGNVTFEPGARTHWHRHSGGQILLVTGGTGYYQERGAEARLLHKGDIVRIPPDIEHWHGAAPDSWFVHVSIETNGADNQVEWLEAVSDEIYPKKVQTPEMKKLPVKEQKTAQIAAFTAAGNMEGLETALNEGLDAGLSINEVKEILIQMYAYAGFPRSLNAINTFVRVSDARARAGLRDPEGPAPQPLSGGADRYGIGKANQAQLFGIREDTPKARYEEFTPAIEVFLKEHLFADIFARGVLSFKNRELATIAALSVLNGVDPMLQSHLNAGMNSGMTAEEAAAVIEAASAAGTSETAANARKILEKVAAARKENSK